jgi:hypothetical protein
MSAHGPAVPPPSGGLRARGVRPVMYRGTHGRRHTTHGPVSHGPHTPGRLGTADHTAGVCGPAGWGRSRAGVTQAYLPHTGFTPHNLPVLDNPTWCLTGVLPTRIVYGPGVAICQTGRRRPEKYEHGSLTLAPHFSTFRTQHFRTQTPKPARRAALWQVYDFSVPVSPGPLSCNSI